MNAPAAGMAAAAMLNAGLALEWVRTILKFSWDEFYHRLAASGGRALVDPVPSMNSEEREVKGEEEGTPQDEGVYPAGQFAGPRS